MRVKGEMRGERRAKEVKGVLTCCRCDLGQSSKGTLLNGKKVVMAPLAPEDTISLGNTTLVFGAKPGIFSGVRTEFHNDQKKEHDEDLIGLTESSL